MCCFSGPVTDVSTTKIFGKGSGEGRQYVVYSMQYETENELAMILPMPVQDNPAEDAVHFINMENFPDFFEDLNSGFPVKRSRRKSNQPIAIESASPDVLEVVEVGSFVASFVPKVSDFGRLDPRFRLGNDVWDDLPQYSDYGFAVF